MLTDVIVANISQYIHASKNNNSQISLQVIRISQKCRRSSEGRFLNVAIPGIVLNLFSFCRSSLTVSGEQELTTICFSQSCLSASCYQGRNTLRLPLLSFPATNRILYKCWLPMGYKYHACESWDLSSKMG